MPIDGLVVLEPSGRPLVQCSYKKLPPSYLLLHIDAYQQALASASDNQPDPVILVQSHNGPAACCHVAHADMTFLCSVRGDDDPLFAFAFLRTFIDVLIEYLGDLSSHVLREHLDVVYQLIEEMLDDGRPLTTELNALREIVMPPSFLNKIISISGMPGLSKTSSNPFTSPIPWRKTGVRYNANEIYFDVSEQMDAVVSKTGSLLDSQIWGKIETKCKLSGTPDLSLTFHNPELLTDVAFHPCVRTLKWVRDRNLSFVPPDGRFILLSYRYQPKITNTLSQQGHYTPLPFILKPTVSRQPDSMSLEVVLSSKTKEPIESFTMRFYLGSGVTTANCTISAGGTWGLEPKTSTLHWDINSILPTSTHTFKCTFSPTRDIRPARSLTTTFLSRHGTFSNLKVDQLKMSGEPYKPYKGVRGSSEGVIEWRI